MPHDPRDERPHGGARPLTTKRAGQSTSGGTIEAMIHLMKADGGFTCGDLKSGRTAYAYPTSDFAKAARRRPVEVARTMLRKENALTYPPTLEENFNIRHVRHMTRLKSHRNAVHTGTTTASDEIARALRVDQVDVPGKQEHRTSPAVQERSAGTQTPHPYVVWNLALVTLSESEAHALRERGVIHRPDPDEWPETHYPGDGEVRDTDPGLDQVSAELDRMRSRPPSHP